MNWKQFYKRRLLTTKQWNQGKTTKETVLKGHSETVFCIKIIDENRVVSAGADARIIFWDVNKQSMELIMNAETGMLGMGFDSESNKLAVGGFSGQMKVIKLNFDKREKLSTFSVRELKDTLKSKKIDFSDCLEKNDLVRRIESSRAMPLADIEKTYDLHSGIIGIDLSNNILASGGRDGLLRIRNLDTESELVLKDHLDAVNCVQLYDSNTKAISAANDALLKMWDVSKAKCVKSLGGHNAWIWGMQFDSKSNTIITSSVDGTLKIWDSNSGKSVHTIKNPVHRELAGISVDFNTGRVAVSSFDTSVRVWDLRSYKCLATLQGHTDKCTRTSLNEDKIFSASFDTTVRIWDFSVI